MAEPDVLDGDSGRPRLMQRLYWRIYLALLASLTVAAILFGLAHLRYGAAPAAMQGFGGHLAMLALLLAIAVVVAVAAFPVVRRLTRRLERLQASVDVWGTGNLSSRVAVEGRDEIARLAMSFNQSAGRIEALMSAQRILLANASHELRSPLARIRMATELLSEAPSAAVRAELARNVMELDQLVEEVLLASRLEEMSAHANSRTVVDLTALVAEECARAAAHFAGKRVEMSGDVVLLRRMIRNLLENAQHHGGGTPILVTLTACANEIVLEVHDGGAGVPPSEREAIFAPFYRARGANEGDGGHGLGLSLVRQIARQHGGEVRCIAAEAGGGRFRVALPR
ncbi:HAMP domain-containing sensor histidine kinase [Sphingomonas sp. BK481]|uniref:sensor histidine kinase n=1 Tax=Sphingomonas sp. BK481 TaxID=2586981 RepID=UPI001857DB40|nr:HAMP domain-containing sensor histidine kinase [Sphingomonas sp. BK481]MBB3588821.1 signal transduction histidine kinase [Sphingomonas sp. BK481]